MSFSFGFYNSLNHDRLYDAIQVSQLFDGLINDGVFATIGNHFMVTTSVTANTVVVKSGRAWFNHTWNYNDADLPVTAPLSDLLLNRIDALVIDIKSDQAYRTNSLQWVQGTPTSGTPQKPALINTSDHHQYPLAYVFRPPNSTAISAANIENAVGTSACPFVTAILQTVSTSELIAQWGAQFDEWFTNEKDTSDAQLIAYMSDFTSRYESLLSTATTEIATWMSSSQREFDTWFANLQVVLDENVAARLTAEVLDLQSRWNRLIRTYDIIDTLDDSSGNNILDNDGNVFNGHVTYMLANDRHK